MRWKSLEDETDAVPPQQRALPRAERGKVLAEEFHTALVGSQDATENRQQRGLAAARRPGQEHALAAADRQIDAAKHGGGDGAATIDLRHALQADGRCRQGRRKVDGPPLLPPGEDQTVKAMGRGR